MPELFDVIELIVDLPEQGLYAGMVGTIVEIHQEGTAYEVEFADDEGRAVNLLALRREQFLVIWRSRTQAWVPPADRVTELVSRLPEETAAQVLDFARFLNARLLRSRSRREAQIPKVSS